MRATRATLLEVLSEDFIRTARAKGCHPLHRDIPGAAEPGGGPALRRARPAAEKTVNGLLVGYPARSWRSRRLRAFTRSENCLETWMRPGRVCSRYWLGSCVSQNFRSSASSRNAGSRRPGFLVFAFADILPPVAIIEASGSRVHLSRGDAACPTAPERGQHDEQVSPGLGSPERVGPRSPSWASARHRPRPPGATCSTTRACSCRPRDEPLGRLATRRAGPEAEREREVTAAARSTLPS